MKKIMAWFKSLVAPAPDDGFISGYLYAEKMLEKGADPQALFDEFSSRSGEHAQGVRRALSDHIVKENQP